MLQYCFWTYKFDIFSLATAARSKEMNKCARKSLVLYTKLTAIFIRNYEEFFLLMGIQQ